MKPSAIGVAAVVATVVLAVSIAVTAVTSASGTPAGSVLVSPPRVVRTSQVDVTIPDCTLARSGAVSDIELSGACDGHLTPAFACVEGEVLALSANRPFGPHGQKFFLTLVVPEFEGPGSYSEVAAVAQITGLGNVSRWTNRELEVEVRDDGSVELSRTVLNPELGTPANGRITVAGRARCKPSAG